MDFDAGEYTWDETSQSLKFNGAPISVPARFSSELPRFISDGSLYAHTRSLVFYSGIVVHPSHADSEHGPALQQITNMKSFPDSYALLNQRYVFWKGKCVHCLKRGQKGDPNDLMSLGEGYIRGSRDTLFFKGALVSYKEDLPVPPVDDSSSLLLPSKISITVIPGTTLAIVNFDQLVIADGSVLPGGKVAQKNFLRLLRLFQRMNAQDRIIQLGAAAACDVSGRSALKDASLPFTRFFSLMVWICRQKSASSVENDASPECISEEVMVRSVLPFVGELSVVQWFSEPLAALSRASLVRSGCNDTLESSFVVLERLMEPAGDGSSSADPLNSMMSFSSSSTTTPQRFRQLEERLVGVSGLLGALFSSAKLAGIEEERPTTTPASDAYEAVAADRQASSSAFLSSISAVFTPARHRLLLSIVRKETKAVSSFASQDATHSFVPRFSLSTTHITPEEYLASKIVRTSLRIISFYFQLAIDANDGEKEFGFVAELCDCLESQLSNTLRDAAALKLLYRISTIVPAFLHSRLGTFGMVVDKIIAAMPDQEQTTFGLEMLRVFVETLGNGPEEDAARKEIGTALIRLLLALPPNAALWDGFQKHVASVIVAALSQCPSVRASILLLCRWKQETDSDPFTANALFFNNDPTSLIDWIRVAFSFFANEPAEKSATEAAEAAAVAIAPKPTGVIEEMVFTILVDYFVADFLPQALLQDTVAGADSMPSSTPERRKRKRGRESTSKKSSSMSASNDMSSFSGFVNGSKEGYAIACGKLTTEVIPHPAFTVLLTDLLFLERTNYSPFLALSRGEPLRAFLRIVDVLDYGRLAKLALQCSDVLLGWATLYLLRQNDPESAIDDRVDSLRSFIGKLAAIGMETDSEGVVALAEIVANLEAADEEGEEEEEGEESSDDSDDSDDSEGDSDSDEYETSDSDEYEEGDVSSDDSGAADSNEDEEDDCEEADLEDEEEGEDDGEVRDFEDAHEAGEDVHAVAVPDMPLDAGFAGYGDPFSLGAGGAGSSADVGSGAGSNGFADGASFSFDGAATLGSSSSSVVRAETFTWGAPPASSGDDEQSGGGFTFNFGS